MKKFEIGHKYFDTWACDSDSISVIKITGRSAKMVTFERGGETRRAKIYTDSHGEYIMPDRYSMACVYRAERELLPEPEQAEAPAPTCYNVSKDLLALAVAGSMFGRINTRQAEFLVRLADGAALIVE